MPHLSLLLVCLALAACGDEGAPAAAAEGADRAAPSPPVAPPSPAVTREAAERAAERIMAAPGVRTVLVAVGSELLVERAAAGAGADLPTNVKSISKSLIGALVGIAIDQGHLEGVEQPLAEVLPQRVSAAAPERARQLRLEHLLTMTAGLQSTSGEHYGAWVSSRDWLRAALDRPVVAPPGERFIYSTGSSHLLGAAVHGAVGRPLPRFAEEVLLDPLGISAAWDVDPQGFAMAGNNLRMTPRALLRFGQLMAAGGVWDGRRLVPRSWIEASTRAHAEGWPDRYGAYGYLWWLPPGDPELWLAAGYAGQFLVVAPGSRLVVVVTSTLEHKGPQWDRRVLDAIRGLALGGA